MSGTPHNALRSHGHMHPKSQASRRCQITLVKLDGSVAAREFQPLDLLDTV